VTGVFETNNRTVCVDCGRGALLKITAVCVVVGNRVQITNRQKFVDIDCYANRGGFVEDVKGQ